MIGLSISYLPTCTGLLGRPWLPSTTSYERANLVLMKVSLPNTSVRRPCFSSPKGWKVGGLRVKTTSLLCLLFKDHVWLYFFVFFVWHRHNLQDDVRQDLYKAVNDWVAAIGKKRKFMGGDQPNLADLVREYGCAEFLNGITWCGAKEQLFNVFLFM